MSAFVKKSRSLYCVPPTQPQVVPTVQPPGSSAAAVTVTKSLTWYIKQRNVPSVAVPIPSVGFENRSTGVGKFVLKTVILPVQSELGETRISKTFTIKEVGL